MDAGGWQKVAMALRELHRALLDRARRDYEGEHGVTINASQLLQLLAGDPYFDWLRSLSELMVDIDMVREAEPALIEEITPAVRPAIEHLISAPKTVEKPDRFAEHYWRYVQDDPHVAMAHAAIKQTIASWPQLEDADAATLLHERHRLAEKARHRAH